MFRTAVAVGFVVLLFGGCQESHSPAVREDGTEPEREIAPPSSLPMNPHAGAHREQAAVPSGPDVDLGEVRLTAPSGWVRKAPRVEFIRAEFALPRVEGDPADGRLTVSVAGGSIKDNVDRWRQQFAGKPEKESQQQLRADGIDVTMVDFSGTYKDQAGMFAPAVERAGYRMLGAIFPLGGQSCFVKAYGPTKTMAARAAEFRTFMESLKASKPAK